ncbi:MAG: hypothetical protein ACPG7W_07715 [Paracoccaceae bacterium]
MSEPIATLTASPSRRAFAAGAQVALGLLLIYLALNTPIVAAGRAALVVMGGLAIWMTLRLWRSTGRQLILTEEGLCDDTGRWIARMDDIAEVERSPFAIKPSNGFALVMREKAPRVWEPGLWWRLGRRVAIGGVTPSAQGKFMADMIAMHIMKRDGRL